MASHLDFRYLDEGLGSERVSRPVAAGQRRRREESREHARDEEREEEPSSFTEFRFRKCNESQSDTTHA